MFNWITSGFTALLMGLGTAAYAAPTNWSFGSTPLTDSGQGALSSATISIEGEFDYDAVTDTVSNVDVTVTLNGTATRIRGSAPNLQGNWLVLTNRVTSGEPVVFFLIDELITSGSSASVYVYAGTCDPYDEVPHGLTCDSQSYGGGITTFEFVATNRAPVANAGPDQSVLPGATGTLDGTGSRDPDQNTTLTYSWSQQGGSGVTLSGSTNVAQPTFTVSSSRSAFGIFRLTVTDNGGLTHTDDVVINVTAPQQTPATEFSAESSNILQMVETTVSQSMMNHLLMLQNVNRGARKRFITLQDVVGYEWNGSAGNLPLQVDGSFDATTTTLSSQGTFFGQAGLGDGARRLVFGDFDIQHDSETGSSTATMNGQIAWEQSVSDKTMLGYFIGGELAHSNIAGSFDGDQNRIGVNAGGYAVREIAQQVYVDGFFSLGAGRNNLTMSNGVLDLESDYTTRTAALGAALSGVIEQQGFDILPELSLSYGRTWIGNVGFTGAAHSLVDNTLSLDAGTVTLANILFRPEFRVPMDGLSGAKSLQVFSFAPRLSCEQVKTTVTEENCGAGAELGFSGSSVDGLSSVSAKITADRLGDRTTSSVQLNLQHRF